MADLKTNYKDDVLDTTQNTKRKYQMIDNGDGTVSFEDVTEYLQQGDSFGADDVNAITDAINKNDGVPVGAVVTFDGSQLPSGFEPYTTAEQSAIAQINDNLTALETRIAKVTVSDSTRISLTPNTEYVTLADGYFRIVCTQGTTTYVDGYVNGSGIIRTTISSGASGMNGIYVKKGSTIKCILSASGVGSGYFYPLS